MDVIKHLRKKFGISRMTLGVAGLKDKRALTRQWISIYDSALKKLGGERAFVDALAEITRVIETGRHGAPINLTTPIRNTFHIRLRADKRLGQSEKSHAIDFITKMLDDGYPNLFGDQRFGINGRNWKQGRDLMLGKSKLDDKREAIFKIQSRSSKLFNDYVRERKVKDYEMVDGDIISRFDDKGHLKY